MDKLLADYITLCKEKKMDFTMIDAESFIKTNILSITEFQDYYFHEIDVNEIVKQIDNPSFTNLSSKIQKLDLLKNFFSQIFNYSKNIFSKFEIYCDRTIPLSSESVKNVFNFVPQYPDFMYYLGYTMNSTNTEWFIPHKRITKDHEKKLAVVSLLCALGNVKLKKIEKILKADSVPLLDKETDIYSIDGDKPLNQTTSVIMARGAKPPTISENTWVCFHCTYKDNLLSNINCALCMKSKIEKNEDNSIDIENESSRFMVDQINDTNLKLPTSTTTTRESKISDSDVDESNNMNLSQHNDRTNSKYSNNQKNDSDKRIENDSDKNHVKNGSDVDLQESIKSESNRPMKNYAKNRSMETSVNGKQHNDLQKPDTEHWICTKCSYKNESLNILNCTLCMELKEPIDTQKKLNIPPRTYVDIAKTSDNTTNDNNNSNNCPTTKATNYLPNKNYINPNGTKNKIPNSVIDSNNRKKSDVSIHEMKKEEFFNRTAATSHSKTKEIMTKNIGNNSNLSETKRNMNSTMTSSNHTNSNTHTNETINRNGHTTLTNKSTVEQPIFLKREKKENSGNKENHKGSQSIPRKSIGNSGSQSDISENNNKLHQFNTRDIKEKSANKENLDFQSISQRKNENSGSQSDIRNADSLEFASKPTSKFESRISNSMPVPTSDSKREKQVNHEKSNKKNKDEKKNKKDESASSESQSKSFKKPNIFKCCLPFKRKSKSNNSFKKYES